MTTINTIFSDVGGVLLTNGWDHISRENASRKFQLDAAEFEYRHTSVLHPFECGRMSLDEYLDKTVFYQPREFSRDDFKRFIFSQSQSLPGQYIYSEMMGLARSGRFRMVMLNNECAEINEYRIQQFQLRQMFQVFCSSCYMNVRKPEQEIYRRGLQIAQRNPEECVFIDDRAENLEVPRRLGMKTVRFESRSQALEELGALGLL